MERIQMNATEGMKLVTELVTINWISEVTGICVDTISKGNKHTVKNGKPYYFNEYQIRKINESILIMAHSIENFMVYDHDPFFQEFRDFGKRIKMTYLFQTVLGKSVKWHRMHMSEKREARYYGKFSEQDLVDIKLGLRQMGAKLKSIELVCDRPE